MSSGTWRISCITFPAFSRRSRSVFASLGFFADATGPKANRPTISHTPRMIRHFVYRIRSASLSAWDTWMKLLSFGRADPLETLTAGIQRQLSLQGYTRFGKGLKIQLHRAPANIELPRKPSLLVCRFF